MRRIILVLVVAAMIAALLPGTAFAAGGGPIHEPFPLGGTVDGGRGSSDHGGGGGGHLTGDLFGLGGEFNGGIGGGSSAENGGGGGGGGCFTASSGERFCGKLV
jgi:hypothetical protein